MKKNFPVSIEFIYQIFSLIVIIIIVHAAYVAVIRPNADAVLARQAAMIEENKSQTTERSMFVLIRDYEQEACFILMFWAIAIMAYKGLMTPVTCRDRFRRFRRPSAMRCYPERCWQLCTVSIPQKIFRMPPAPPMPIAPLRPKGSSRNCP
jgi:hypothetical protein